ncbi:MAG: sulfite exporter TauE/SafE family protein [Rhodospirillales bacterium]|nr:sulfite exporter TauE/SafE family protein [Rhodospirillales bacterium]
MIGLGGGEFRLPVLIRVIGFPARAAIPLNLVVSLATLSFALVTRNHVVPASAVLSHLPEVVGLIVGGVLSACYGTALVVRLSDRRLTNMTCVLLLALGALLIAEAFIPFERALLVSPSETLRALAGVVVGLGVGVVSSMLGVAGGELLIPALIFIFGADIKIAGTASLIISLFIVATGVWRYHRTGTLPMRGGPQRIAFAMIGGSLIGVALGGLAVAFAPTLFLKVSLGMVLIVAAIKTMAGAEGPGSVTSDRETWTG